jgi:protein-disulfide isomerase
MKKTSSWVLVSLLIGALAACSRQPEAPPASPVADAPAPAPVAVPPKSEADAPLSPELAARLVRDHSPVIGPRNAPVTIVEFLDPACEACRAFAPVVKQILFMHPEEVRVVIRYAAFHQGSDEAVRLLEAARQQGKFETALNALFDGQQDWASHHAPNVDRAWQLAAAAGIEMARARRDARSAQADKVLRQDGEDVVALKVERTPTFFVNGRLLTDFGDRQLLALVKQEVARAGGAGTP